MFKKPEGEKRVPLNCLVAPGTLAWLKAAERSQGEAVDFAVGCATTQEKVVPAKKVSRREKEIAERAASDVTAQRVGRPEIDYSDVESTPTTHIATLDAVGPQSGNGQGKVSIESWRASRKPLLKHKDRK